MQLTFSNFIFVSILFLNKSYILLVSFLIKSQHFFLGLQLFPLKCLSSKKQYVKFLSIAQDFLDTLKFDEVSNIKILPPDHLSDEINVDTPLKGFSQPVVVIYFPVDEDKQYLTSRQEDIMNEIWLELYNLMGLTVELHSKMVVK